MPHIPRIAIDQVPEASRRLLERFEHSGTVSNLLRTVAASPAALEGYLGLGASLAKGSLPSPTGRRIALAIAEFNGCDYTVSSNVDQARRIAKLCDAEITANRSGRSNDPKADVAVRFAVDVARERGRIGRPRLDALISAGYDHAQAVEIVHHVALAILSDYLHEVAGTEIDFPLVRSRKAAAFDRA